MTELQRSAANLRADKYHVYRPLLDLIGFTEGTDKGRGYNETLAYGKMLDGKVTKGKGPTVELVSMPLKELDALQTKMLTDPDNKKLNSSAAGRYQIVRTTARAIRKALPDRYPLTRKFDADCQDEMACYLLGVRGIDKYLAGRLSEDALINNLAHEWASLPKLDGKGAYAGQHAAVKPTRVRAVLAEVRKRHKEGQPVTPVVPEAVEKAVKQQTNAGGWLVGLGGVGGTVLTGLFGADWETVLAVGGVGISGLVVLFLLRHKIIAAVREIKAEVSS